MLWRKQLAVYTIKITQPTTINFIVEKEGMLNFYQSTRCHNQDDSFVYRHCSENLKCHSKTKNPTSNSTSVHKIASCPTFQIVK